MSVNRNQQVRRKSMQGTSLLASGVIAIVAYFLAGYLWLACAAVVLCAAGVVLLYQVGRSLP